MLIATATLRARTFEALVLPEEAPMLVLAVSNMDRVREGAYPMTYFWRTIDDPLLESERLPETHQTASRIDVEVEGGTYEVMKMPPGVLLEVFDFDAGPADANTFLDGEACERRYWYMGLRQIASTMVMPEGLPNA